MLKTCVIVVWTDIKRVGVNWNMDKIKADQFSLAGQLESLSLEQFFLTVFKILPYWEFFWQLNVNSHYCSNILRKSSSFNELCCRLFLVSRFDPLKKNKKEKIIIKERVWSAVFLAMHKGNVFASKMKFFIDLHNSLQNSWLLGGVCKLYGILIKTYRNDFSITL